MKPAIAFLLAALSLAQASSAPLKIVCSFLPLYATTKSIVGDKAEVFQLARAGVGPHEFSPKPSDLKTLAAADLLIINGLGLEEWLNKTVDEVGSKKLRIVDTTKPFLFDKLVGSASPGNEGALSSLPFLHEGNPHVWLDPVLAEGQATVIFQAVVKADPANVAYYEANYRAYDQKLRALDAAFRAFFATVETKNLVTFHDAFPYFCARYGLNYLASVEEFPEKAPSPRQLARIVDLIKANHVKVVFAEEGYEPKILRALAAETGATVAELDTLEVGEPDADAYLTRMRANLDALKKAWQ